jgi:L-iditol 2-dehydrogenase
MTSVLSTSQLPATMQATLFYQPGDVRFETIKTPEPALGEIVIQVMSALTCGTDLKTYRRGHPVLLKNFPSPFGHECAGIVAAVGEDVTQFSVGDRVVAANSAPCLNCFYCQKQQYNLCQHLDLLNGAYAEYLKIPAQIVRQNTLKIPASIPFTAAAFAEPLAVSLRGMEACHIRPGDWVAVMGLGAIGQFIVRLAKLQGAHVVAIGRSELKRAMAKRFGHADITLDIAEYPNFKQLKAEFTPEGQGFDVVIEAIGQPQTWEGAIELVRRGGLVNLFGGCERETHIHLSTQRLHYDELTLISLFHHTPEYFRKALTLINEDLLDPMPLIGETLPLCKVIEALEKVAAGQAVKIALTPE